VPRAKRTATAASKAQLCRLSAIMTPNIRMNDTGISNMAPISTTFDSGEGFSNGCALLTLNAPPPSPDSSLIDSHDATGPPSRV
jgi:hypothetical protein